MNFTAIPTKYHDIEFRSRLEARWAAYFDLTGWEYEYEPFDLKGYIPDFVLKFEKPIIVEVKPVVTEKDFDQYKDRLLRSGWDKEILLVGATFFDNGCGETYSSVGLLYDVESKIWSCTKSFYCTSCRRSSFWHCDSSYHCRSSGCNYDYRKDINRCDNDLVFPDREYSRWREAGNRVQWRKPE